MPVDLGEEQAVGSTVIGDLLVRQEGDQTFLEGVKAALDFSFGLGIGSDAVGDPESGEGALELGMGIEAVGRRAVTEKGEAIGVEGGRGSVLLEGWTEMREVAPGGVTGHEGASDDFARVVIGGKDESGVGGRWPPGMRRGVMLPKFADGGALPPATGLWAGPLWGEKLGEVLAHVIRHRGASAVEIEATSEFVGQEGEIERLAVGQKLGQEVVDGLGPGRAVVTPGGLRLEGAVIL